MEQIKILFPKPLKKSIFLERPNRFILHCVLEEGNEQVIVHLADPGRLKELLQPGTVVWLLENDNPKRKTRWTAVLCENPLIPGGFVSINTTYPNRLIERALKQNAIEELNGWNYKKSEYKLGVSRWDFLLENNVGRELLLEVKSVTLADDRVGRFPDAVTARGTKHVKELSEIAHGNLYETAILFVAQREDLDQVTTASHIDPLFAEAFANAYKSGVKMIGRSCFLSLDGIGLGNKLEVYPEEQFV
ncbi:DNA/RNA nuclease SfsA [Bacillus sp. 31A1R]|uniref:Sugar fermentation stimulation protein homolog n=1 Tax=Robertmurraya mangrovi TaxID=3098077 RepID=A0ABU5J4B3_9BACI|nr:DNA/RNA nuclease SfsA [Bacillus sp. 31A1R]MDZ5474205.1 DNA/RNA nuclease SfsA [Bacillus sp. 31A1R]